VLDAPPLSAKARILQSGGLKFVLGENRACDDRILRGEHDAPLIAIQVLLRGNASLEIEGLDARIGGTVGEVAFYAAEAGRSTVALQAGVTNQGFRILFSRDKVEELASRYPPLHVVVEQASFVRRRPLARELDIASLFDSADLGALRPMFLEGRALEWLAIQLAAPPSPERDAVPRRDLERVHAARDIVLTQLDAMPTLGELATMVGTNEFTLKRTFKRVFGQPVYAFALAHRLEHAKKLVLETDLSLKEIATAIGYAHASHFSTAFRRRFGVTPSACRDRSR
jgi:AraC-like DNA-binding protein